MSDGPPDWGDVPPADMSSYGQPAPAGGQRGGTRGGGGTRPAAMTQEQLADASADFYEWLTTPATLDQLKMLLPDHVDTKVFIATCKTAALTKPDLLREDLRASLLTSIMKGAGMGLLPDGKQGALIARWDSDAKKHQVAFQPMVDGIKKLGRETGAIRNIRAVIVFHGEPFRIIQGDEDRIDHEVEIDIVEEAYAALNGGRDNRGNPIAKPDEFLGRVRAAYCIITGIDGTITKRWMTKSRIVSLKESSKANFGPWNSRFIDEMVLKGVILFTCKWINLDTESVQAKRFQSALMTDMEVDFDRQGQIAGPANQDRPSQAALPAPADKLGSLEDAIMGKTKVREKVPVDPGRESSPLQSTAPGTQGGGDRSSPPSPMPQAPQETAGPAQSGRSDTQQQEQRGAEDMTLIQRASEALEREQQGHRWKQALIAATRGCETAADLQILIDLPSVKANRKDAPAAIRSEINALLDATSKRLAEPVAEEPSGRAEDDGGWASPKVGEPA
jgi:phage RecT family recombinase